MNVGIMCGSSDMASLESRGSNSEAVYSIANKGYTFVMGAGESGSMRDAKEIIRENGNMLITVGNRFELERGNADVKVEVSSTFERAERLYENSDVIIFLDGGTGTMAEFYSFLNNKIETNDDKTKLVLYNKEGYYNKVIDDLKRRYKEGLASNILTYFKEVRGPLELETYLEEVEKKLNGSEQERERVI